MSAPRVLVLGSVLGHVRSGGARHAENALPRAARLLAEQGGRLLVLGPAREPEWLTAARAAGAPLEHRPADLGQGPLARWRREGPALSACLRAHPGPWVLHQGHLPLPRGLPPELPLCWMLHDPRQLDAELVGGLRARLGQRLLGRAAARAARIVVPSRSVAGDLAARFPDQRHKLLVARHGSDHFVPDPREPGRYLLGLGHLEKRKNWSLILRALALDPGLPPLLLCGRDVAGEARRLARLAAELGLGARYQQQGPVPEAELPALYASAAALVLPSRMEGFGLPVLEAQLAGVPVTLARAGALPEVGGPQAISFDPRSPEQALHALRAALAKGPAELAAARRHAQGFRWDHAARQLVDAWIACSVARPAPPSRG
jgi:glycosyltransferase involved in cell wall biosynthesis